jgi:hypothetical protein
VRTQRFAVIFLIGLSLTVILGSLSGVDSSPPNGEETSTVDPAPQNANEDSTSRGPA